MTKIETKCKPNLSLSGVLVYISSGRRPPVTEIETKCKPNLSLSGVWFTFSTGSARHELYCQQVVAFSKPEATIFEF